MSGESTGTALPQSHPRPPRWLPCEQWAQGQSGFKVSSAGSARRDGGRPSPVSVPPLAQLLTPGPIFPGPFRMFLHVLRVTPQPPLRIVLRRGVVFFCLHPSGTGSSFSATHSLCVWVQQSLPSFPAFLVMTQASAGEGRACPGEWLGGGTAGSESAKT